MTETVTKKVLPFSEVSTFIMMTISLLFIFTFTTVKMNSLFKRDPGRKKLILVNGTSQGVPFKAGSLPWMEL